MAEPLRFSDGASYEAMMGSWTRSVGTIFLDWIQPRSGLAWIDVGCGSGAFTELAIERCAPGSIVGIDPSGAQLEFARGRGLGDIASFRQGDAMALPFGEATFDVAAAALVVHFMPDPGKGVAEMVRVTKRGGIVATYSWDMLSGGFPYDALNHHMAALGFPPAEPPHPEAAETSELRRLWTAAGLEAIQQREIVVSRPFPDFDAYWSTAITAPRTKLVLETMPSDVVADLKNRVRDAVPTEAGGAVRPVARANAIWGRVP